MSEWKECTLGDVITLQRGHDLPKSKMIDGNIPVAGSNGVIGYHNESTTKAPGITIGRSGNLGNAYLYKIDFWAHNTTLYVKDFKGNNEVFIFYFLKNIDFRQFNVGSAVPTLNRNHIHPLQVTIPPLPEQKAIASVLSSLDDKIDLLHRQNKTLEAMAETLFRQWFVEEAEERWEEKTLSSIAEHKKYNVKPDQNPATIYRHYSIPAFDDGKQPIKELGSEIKSNKYQVVPNSILISKLNPRFPRVWAITDLMEETSICSTEFQVVLPVKSEYYGFIYCFLKSKQVTDELIGAASGTSGSHQRVKPEDIFNLTFQMPTQKKIDAFNLITSDHLKKVSTNMKQIRTLEKLRDTLLPKLMSGEVRVEYEENN